MNAIMLQRGDGKGRDPWAIRKWLAATPARDMAGVMRLAGVKHHHQVSDTVRGGRNDRRVLKALEELGCPEELLYPQRAARRDAGGGEAA